MHYVKIDIIITESPHVSRDHPQVLPGHDEASQEPDPRSRGVHRHAGASQR